jgi:putative DNA methylase
MTQRRLIEEIFPLKKVSADSRHEKNVRHGHMSTPTIWPARRPLAACRAAIIAALLPDPGNESSRRARPIAPIAMGCMYRIIVTQFRY